MPDRILRGAIFDSPRFVDCCGEQGKMLAGTPPFRRATASEVANVLRVCFIWCISNANDFGNLEYNPTDLRRAWQDFGADGDTALGAVVTALAEIELIRLYDAEGKRYINIPRFRQRLRYFKKCCPVHPDQQQEYDAKKAEHEKRELGKHKSDSSRSGDVPESGDRQADDGPEADSRRMKLKLRSMLNSTLTSEDHKPKDNPTVAVSPPLRDVAPAPDAQSLAPALGEPKSKTGNGTEEYALTPTPPASPPAFDFQQQSAVAAMSAKLAGFSGRSVKASPPKASTTPACPVQAIVEIYNEKCARGFGGRTGSNGMAPAKSALPKSLRERLITKRWKEVFDSNPNLTTVDDGLLYFSELFAYASTRDLLNGRTDRKWKADLNWMLNDDQHFNAVDERTYENAPRKGLFNRGGEESNPGPGGSRVSPNSPWVKNRYQPKKESAPLVDNTRERNSNYGSPGAKDQAASQCEPAAGQAGASNQTDAVSTLVTIPEWMKKSFDQIGSSSHRGTTAADD